MNEFHFLRPHLLLLLLPCLLLVWLLLRQNKSKSIWHKICSPELMPYILLGGTKRFFSILLLFCTIFTLMVIALAGPAWQTIAQPLLKKQSGLVIALDLSPEMDAEDIKPSRLKRAVYKINDLLNLRHEGQTALLVYSKEPFVVTPLTEDSETIKALLPALETQIMPAAGQGASKAIIKAAELLKQSDLQEGSVLLVTAELSTEEREKAVTAALKQNLRVFVLGVGTLESTPIVKADGGFVTNNQGALILTALAEKNLKSLAQSTHGQYASISLDDSDIINLNSHFDLDHDTALTENEQSIAWHDQGYLIAMIVLPFAVLLFRRGIFLSLLFFMPFQTLQAWSWESLWRTSDQQAAQLFKEEQYIEAQQKFSHSNWQAAASYRNGDYENAAQLFAQNSDLESLYNFGTTKAKQGDFTAALEAYDKLLVEQPDHADALYNKKLIEDLLQQQQNQKPDQNDKSEKQDDKQKSSQQEKQNSQNSADQNKENSSESSGSSNQEQQKESQQSEAKQDEQQNEKSNQPQEGKARDNNAGVKDDQAPLSDEVKQQYRDQMTEQMEQQEKQSSEKIAESDNQMPEDQQKQIDERWLQRIPEDPAGLLRRKFLYQYKQQQKQNRGYQR